MNPQSGRDEEIPRGLSLMRWEFCLRQAVQADLTGIHPQWASGQFTVPGPRCSGAVGGSGLPIRGKGPHQFAPVRGDFIEIELMRGLRLAVAADQSLLLQFLEDFHACTHLLSGALVELRKVWLSRNFPQQVLVGQASQNSSVSGTQRRSQSSHPQFWHTRSRCG